METVDIFNPALSRNFEAVSNCQHLHTTFKWIIKNISKSVSYDYYESPPFSFCNSTWAIVVNQDFDECAFVDLSRLDSVTGDDLEILYKISLKDFKGNDHYTVQYIYKFEGYGTGEYDAMAIVWEKLLVNREELLPNDTMTVFCELTFFQSPRHIFIGVLQQVPVNQSTRVGSTHFCTLSNDLEEAFRNQSFSDAKLVVGYREFPVHKIILAARSPVFSAMFEQSVNTVQITDIDTSTVEELLKYIYTGQVLKSPIESVFKLFFAAEKYSLEELKRNCVSSMLRYLTLDTFYETAIIAHLCGDMYLKAALKSFFNENFQNIIERDGWKTFKLKKPDAALELMENEVLLGRK